MAKDAETEINPGDCRMDAPIDGRIGAVWVKVGNLVWPVTGSDSARLAMIQHLNPMGVDLQPSSRHLAPHQWLGYSHPDGWHAPDAEAIVPGHVPLRFTLPRPPDGGSRPRGSRRCGGTTARHSGSSRSSRMAPVPPARRARPCRSCRRPRSSASCARPRQWTTPAGGDPSASGSGTSWPLGSGQKATQNIGVGSTSCKTLKRRLIRA